MRERKHIEFASRVGAGATSMHPNQLPAFAEWLREHGYHVIHGTNGYTDAIAWLTATNDGWLAQWTRRGGEVRCSQMAHLGGPLAAEFLREVSRG